MSKTVVPPLRQRGELLFLLIVTLSILLIATLLLALSGKKSTVKKLKSYQINAIEKLGPNDRKLFTELYSQAAEIERLHFTGGEQWPDIKLLEDELIPPFSQDALWSNKIKHTWTLFPNDRDDVHFGAYLGKSGNPTTASSFILVFEHFHTMDGAYYIGINKEKAFSIWVKPGEVSIPSDFSQGALISSGWYQAVAYTGSDELKKMGRGQ